MKNNILIFALILFSFPAAAQYNVSATEIKDKFAGAGNQPAIMVKIFDRSASAVQTEWKRMMRWQHRSKITESGLEIFADDVNLKNVSENTIDIYTKPVLNSKGFLEYRVAVNLGGAYLTKKSHPKQYEAMAEYLEQFAYEQSQIGIKERIEKEEYNLEQLKNKRSEYQSEITDFNAEIAELERKIQLIKDQIAANNRLIEAENKKIQSKEEELQKLRSVTIQK